MTIYELVNCERRVYLQPLYDQVDKINKKKDAVATKSKADAIMLKCYAKSEEENSSEVSEEDHAKQSGAIYSVINKHTFPKVPPNTLRRT